MEPIVWDLRVTLRPDTNDYSVSVYRRQKPRTMSTDRAVVLTDQLVTAIEDLVIHPLPDEDPQRYPH